MSPWHTEEDGEGRTPRPGAAAGVCVLREVLEEELTAPLLQRPRAQDQPNKVETPEADGVAPA